MLAALIVFPCYAFMNYATIPLVANTCAWDISDESDYMDPFVAADLPVTIADSLCIRKEVSIEIRVPFTIFVITLMSFVGWLFLIFFLPTGMQAFPFDLIT